MEDTCIYDGWLKLYKRNINGKNYEVVKNHKDLISDITLSKSPKSALENVIIKIISDKNYKVNEVNRAELIREVINHILGYGIMQKYIDMPDFNNAYVNSFDNVWIKIGSKKSF